VFQKTTELPAL